MKDFMEGFWESIEEVMPRKEFKKLVAIGIVSIVGIFAASYGFGFATSKIWMKIVSK